MSRTPPPVHTGQWFHGDRGKRHGFHDQRELRDPSRESSNELGPGVYWTRDRREASTYAYPDGYVYTATMRVDPRRVMRDRRKLSPAQVQALIEWAPEESRAYGLMNWHESPARAMQLVRQAYSDQLNSNAFVPIWREFYGSDDRAFRGSMVALGYDVFLDYDRPRLLVWNPAVIDVVGEEPYGSFE